MAFENLAAADQRARELWVATRSELEKDEITPQRIERVRRTLRLINELTTMSLLWLNSWPENRWRVK